MSKTTEFEILTVSPKNRQLVLNQAWLRENLGLRDDQKYVIAHKLPTGAVLLKPFDPTTRRDEHLASLASLVNEDFAVKNSVDFLPHLKEGDSGEDESIHAATFPVGSCFIEGA
ncbi:MAG: hypothetical protein ACNI3A_14985 [Desulfovibrio sp.]|uniref:hypothetical protein n=1 Tax=Desulfovibrio sp. 7SRBS1 TaxID=3378064 RepID=UPI003B3BFDD4